MALTESTKQQLRESAYRIVWHDENGKGFYVTRRMPYYKFNHTTGQWYDAETWEWRRIEGPMSQDDAVAKALTYNA